MLSPFHPIPQNKNKMERELTKSSNDSEEREDACAKFQTRVEFEFFVHELKS